MFGWSRYELEHTVRKRAEIHVSLPRRGHELTVRTDRTVPRNTRLLEGIRQGFSQAPSPKARSAKLARQRNHDY